MIVDGVSNAKVYAISKHVELRTKGWWDDAVRRATEYELYVINGGLSDTTLFKKVNETLGSSVDRSTFSENLQIAAKKERLYESNDKYYLTETAEASLRTSEEAAKKIGDYCKNKYEQVIAPIRRATSRVPEWEDFKVKVLYPLTKELGVHTLSFLKERTPPPSNRTLDDFVNGFSSDVQDKLKKACIDFLDPNDPTIRSLVHGYLNHYMLISSSALDRKTLENLRTSINGAPEFNILVDTNVIFSLLNLHKNPSNDAVQSFVELASKSQDIKVNLYALEATVQEALRTLEAVKEDFSGMTPQNIATAAVKHGDVSGLPGRFYEVAATSGGMDAEIYFSRYALKLRTLLAGHSVQIIDEDIATYKANTSFQQKVSDWMSFEEGRAKPRARGKVLHDVLAMEYVRLQRTGTEPTLPTAKWWFLTADQVLQNYERRGLQGSPHPPKCINPAEMLQILRFWVPLNENLEKALVGGIRMPFSFFSYDAQAEVVSTAIIKRISKEAQITDFPQDLADELLADQALRETIGFSEADSEATEQAFQNALGRQLEELRKRLDESHEKIQILSQKNNALAHELQRRANEKQPRIQKKTAPTKQNRRSDANQIRQTQEIAQLRASLEDMKVEAKNNAERDRKHLFIAMLIIASVVAISFSGRIPLPLWAVTVIVCFALVIFGLISLYALRLNHTSWGNSVKKLAVTLGGFILSGIISTFISYTLVTPSN